MSQALPELVRRISRQNVQQYYVGTIHQSDIYKVPQGWEAAVLADDEAVHTVNDARSFEDAVESEAISSIFVPQAARLAQALAEKILERHHTENTIYWETVKKA